VTRNTELLLGLLPLPLLLLLLLLGLLPLPLLLLLLLIGVLPLLPLLLLLLLLIGVLFGLLLLLNDKKQHFKELLMVCWGLLDKNHNRTYSEDRPTP
jgi:hypothetical protein